MKPFERGIESEIRIIDLSNGQLPTNAKVNDLFFIKKGAYIDDVLFEDNAIIIAKNNTRQLPKASDFDFITPNVAINTITVNSVNDLPVPIDTDDGLGLAYRLEDGKIYYFGTSVTLEYPIVAINNTLTGNWGSYVIYTGSGALFRNNSTTQLGITWVKNLQLVGTGNNKLIDVQDCPLGRFGFDFMNFNDFEFGNFVNNYGIYFWDSTPINMRAGLNLSGNLLFYLTAQDNNLMYNNMGGDALYNFSGENGIISFTHITASPYSGDALFNFDSATWNGRATIDISYFDNSNGGTVFLTGSLDQKDPRIRVTDLMNGVPDSHIIGSFYMEDNLTATTAPIGLTGRITAFQDAGAGKTRIVTTSTPPDGSTVWIIDDSYTGKYTTSNTVLNTSFEIVKEYSVTGTGLWETGWTKILGITLPRKNEEAEQTGNNELTFYNLEGKDVVIHAHVNAKNESGATATEREFCIMKNEINRIKMSKVTTETTNITKTVPMTAPTTIIENDTLSIYTRNITTSNAMLPVSMGLVAD